MTDRKCPTSGFWITLALVTVLVGYPLSYGPAAWLVFRVLPPRATPMIGVFYIPLVWAADKTNAARHARESWLALWVGR